MRSKTRAYGAVLALFIGLTLICVSIFSMLPVHRSSLAYTDPIDLPGDPDHDIISITGTLDGSNYRVDMKVLGQIDISSRYVINIVADLPENRHIYALEYFNGEERAYDVTSSVVADTLSIFFPLDKLRSGAIIVGIEGVARGPSTSDYAQEGLRWDLPMQTMLNLPISSTYTLVGGILICLASVYMMRYPKPVWI